MNTKFLLKQKLYKACERNIMERIQTIQERFRSIEEARNNESKSSVGDKHETGRAMMQLEEERISVQLSQATQVKNYLAKIELSSDHTSVRLGNLVNTTKGDYFIAIGIGKVKIADALYFCISLDSPIGMQLLGKKLGDKFIFNGNEISINAIY